MIGAAMAEPTESHLDANLLTSLGKKQFIVMYAFLMAVPLTLCYRTNTLESTYRLN